MAPGPAPARPPKQRRGAPEELYEFSGILMGVAMFGAVLAVAFNIFLWLPLEATRARSASDARDMRDGEQTAFRFADCELRGLFGRLRLKDRAGRTVTISQYTANRMELRNTMAKRITALQIQGARERLQQGMTLIFGPFRLTAQALGHEQRRLPWEQVGEVRAVIIWGRGNRSRLTVYQHMKVLPWAYSFSPHHDIPNVDLFLQLVNECKARRFG